MNILTGLLFVFLLVVLFVVLILASKPSKHQKTVQKRLGQLGLGEVVEEEDKKGEVLLKQPADLGFPLFDRLLSRLHLYLPLKALIEQADSKSSPGKVLVTSVAMAGAGFMVCSMFVPVLALRALAAVVAGASPILLLRFKRARRLKAFNDALPDSIDLMARALRAGHSVASAIEVVAEQGNEPVASEFALVYQQQNFGLPFRDALMTMAHRVQSKDLQFVVTAMLVQKETGGNLAEILDRTTCVIRERMRIFGEVRTKSAQGRLTGWILTLLPVVMGFAINLINHGFEKPLFTEPIGHIMLYVGGGMLATGSFIISRIVDIEV
jgi:tight adherence protein B